MKNQNRIKRNKLQEMGGANEGGRGNKGRVRKGKQPLIFYIRFMFTYCTALCWSERTEDVTWPSCMQSDWCAGSICAATGWSLPTDRLASLRTPSCSASTTWTCRTTAYLQERRNLCRRSGFSLVRSTQARKLCRPIDAYRVRPKSGTFCMPYNFVKYWPIFKLPEFGENL